MTIEQPRYASYPSLTGRSVFITGGGSGIGESLVRHFSDQGSRVAFVDVAVKASQALVKSVASTGAPAPLFMECDLRDIDGIRAAVSMASQENGPISVLCNNA